MVKLNMWLTARMEGYEQDYSSLALSGLTTENVLLTLSNDVPYYFGNKFTRGWYEENKYWLSPEITSVIDKKLETTAFGSDLEFFDRIDSRFP